MCILMTHALPIASLGLRMDDEVVLVAMGLHFGTALCYPHHAISVGQGWTSREFMAYIPKKDLRRHPCHMAINDIIKRSLASAKISAHLEPLGICRADGKRPDEATVMPGRSGRVLVWDATCPDTFAPSHLQLANWKAGAVADQAEQKKKAKYAELSATHHFVPMAIETMGVFGKEAQAFSLSLVAASRKRRENPYYSTACCNGSWWSCRGGMQLQYCALTQYSLDKSLFCMRTLLSVHLTKYNYLFNYG